MKRREEIMKIDSKWEKKLKTRAIALDRLSATPRLALLIMLNIINIITFTDIYQFYLTSTYGIIILILFATSLYLIDKRNDVCQIERIFVKSIDNILFIDMDRIVKFLILVSDMFIILYTQDVTPFAFHNFFLIHMILDWRNVGKTIMRIVSFYNNYYWFNDVRGENKRRVNTMMMTCALSVLINVYLLLSGSITMKAFVQSSIFNGLSLMVTLLMYLYISTYNEKEMYIINIMKKDTVMSSAWSQSDVCVRTFLTIISLALFDAQFIQSQSYHLASTFVKWRNILITWGILYKGHEYTFNKIRLVLYYVRKKYFLFKYI